jgi:hypothetical protein
VWREPDKRPEGFGLSLIFLCYFLCIKAKKVKINIEEHNNFV